ncbi:hypothetical protein BKA93DRAFT_778823 [Sparassis latifolia]
MSSRGRKNRAPRHGHVNVKAPTVPATNERITHRVGRGRRTYNGALPIGHPQPGRTSPYRASLQTRKPRFAGSLRGARRV